MRVDIGAATFNTSFSRKTRGESMGVWASGIAGDARAAVLVLANFRQLAGERVVKIHPLRGRLVEQEARERLRGGLMSTASGDCR